MKIQVTQDNLQHALSLVARVASSRATLPILSNILIKTSQNRVSLIATNLDIVITHHLGAKVSTEGSITVPARLMQDFISSLPSGLIDMSLEKTKLHISADTYNSVINGTSAEDFPTTPSITSGTEWKVDAQALKKALQQVVFVASSDETRPILTGVLLYTHEGSLVIASTDSYRLAEARISKQKQEIHTVVPASALQDLLRIINDTTKEVTVTYDDQQIIYKVDETELVARLIEGKYPDYQKLIPNTFTTQATLKREDLVRVTKISSLFARESAGSVTIAVDEKAQEISIRSVASQVGENNATAGAQAKGSDTITVNSKFLLEALGAFHGEKITFSFNGKLEPTLLQDPDNPEYRHVIMPLKS